MLQNYVEISVIIFMVATTLISGLSACPSGCICRGSPAQRDTAVCYKPWADRDRAVQFDEPITSIEFRHLLFQDVEPYLSAVRHASTVVIYPPKTSSKDNPLPEDLFNSMDRLEALTIHPTVDRLAPPGLARAIMPLTKLKTLDFVGNTMLCDCALPDTLASRNILVLAKSRMPAVKGCKQHGFPGDLYNINDFLKKCAERGGYQLSEPSKEGAPVNHAGLSNRIFGNVRDRNLFNKGISHSRINANPIKPFGAKSSPGSFRGTLGKPPSGDMRRLGPGEKRVLLPGAMPGRARRPPSFSASQLARLHSQNSRPRSGRWGRRRLLSLDEGDTDLAPLKAIDLHVPPGKDMQERREGGTQGVSQVVSLRIRREPVKVTPGMTMTEFINKHKRRDRKRGRRRRKNKNGWTRLSGGWRMREIRSIDGANDSDPALLEAIDLPPDEEMRERREAGTQAVSQGVSLRIRREPVKVTPGMTMTEFINKHKRRDRKRGRRRRKNKNGWTRLSGGWRMREIRSIDGANDSGPALLEAIDLPPDEEMRERREAGTQAVSQGVSLRIRREPVKVTPGMTMTEFINKHKRRDRKRGRRRRKNKNGWTRLSGGWRMREIRSIDGANDSDPALPGAIMRGKRSVDDEDIDLLDEVIRPNQTEHQLTEDATNQRIIGNGEQQNLNVNQQENQGQPNDALQLEPRVDVGPHRRPHDHPQDQEHDHRHHNSPGEKARQLAMYQLPMNDLTVKLNPFDPFEVDLFFQYILHKEGSPGPYGLPHP